MYRFIVLTIALLLLTACNTSRQSSDKAVTDFENRLSQDGIVVFRSWNGRAIGMDCDTEFVFQKDGVVKMLEYGYGLLIYQGTFEVGSDKVIRVSLDGFPAGWPEMVLQQDETDLLLYPKNQSKGPIFGTRGGMYVPPDAGSYWPFRQLRGESKNEVLRTVKDHELQELNDKTVWYGCMINSKGLPKEVSSDRDIIGFYTWRYAKTDNAEDAKFVTMQMLKFELQSEWSLDKAAIDKMTFVVEEVRQFDKGEVPESLKMGFIFYSTDDTKDSTQEKDQSHQLTR